MSDSQVEPASPKPTRRRPRGLAACHRCKSRKQRCDNGFPACSNCSDAGENCSYGAKQAYPAAYVKSLEHQIAKLQAELASPRSNVVSSISSSSIQQQQMFPVVSTQPDTTEPTKAVETANSDLEASAGIVAPSPESFLGTSSGYPLTKLLRSALPLVDAHHEVNVATSSSIGMCANEGQQTRDGQASDNSYLPSKEVGDKLIETYYARVHPKHPFLPRNRVQMLHQARLELIPAHKAMCLEGGRSRCDYATLQLVYAIGGRYLQLSNDDDHSSPMVRPCP